MMMKLLLHLTDALIGLFLTWVGLSLLAMFSRMELMMPTLLPRCVFLLWPTFMVVGGRKGRKACAKEATRRRRMKVFLLLNILECCV